MQHTSCTMEPLLVRLAKVFADEKAPTDKAPVKRAGKGTADCFLFTPDSSQRTCVVPMRTSLTPCLMPSVCFRLPPR